MKRKVMVMAVLAIALSGCSQNKRSVDKPQEGNSTENPSKASNSSGITSQSPAATEKTSAASGKVNYLSTADFKKKVMDYEAHPQEWVYEGSRPAVIDFYATWCRPCKMMSPIVEQLANDYADKIDFYKVDIDKEQELASVFGIQSIPTFLFIPMKGMPTAQMGAMQKEEFEKIVKEVMGE